MEAPRLGRTDSARTQPLELLGHLRGGPNRNRAPRACARGALGRALVPTPPQAGSRLPKRAERFAGLRSRLISTGAPRRRPSPRALHATAAPDPPRRPPPAARGEVAQRLRDHKVDPEGRRKVISELVADSSDLCPTAASLLNPVTSAGYGQRSMLSCAASSSGTGAARSFPQPTRPVSRNRSARLPHVAQHGKGSTLHEMNPIFREVTR